MHAPQSRSLDEAKLNLVHRFGEAARTIADRNQRTQQGSSAKRRKQERPNDTAHPAYRQLYRISYLESSEAIRAAGAQEIGAGGDEAFDMLEGVLGPSDDPDSPDGQAAPHAGEETTGETGPRPQTDNGTPQEDHGYRELILRAWLAPLLTGSVDDRARDARDNLERWLQFVSESRSVQARYDPNPRLYLEVALAQGFKHAANRRPRHPHAMPEVRYYLAEQAMEMLKNSRFWFSQLTLLHALCLWELQLPRDDFPKEYRRSTDPSRIVLRWADRLGRPQHPFVVETLRLVTWALDTGVPERFIWIDERDVAAKIGSYPAHLASTRKHNLWIPSSAGWAVLHPRAQKLLADVLLLLNLTERGQQASDYSLRLRWTSTSDLPPCLTRNRDPLDPERTIGGLYTPPGSNCLDGCHFRLCPYPPKREASSRTELSESFCLRQQTLTKSHLALRLTAPWQEMTPAHLRLFWARKYSVNPWDLDSHPVAELRKRPRAPRDDRRLTWAQMTWRAGRY